MMMRSVLHKDTDLDTAPHGHIIHA